MFCLPVPSLLTSRRKRMLRTEHQEDPVTLPLSTSVSSLDSLESLPKLDSYERICW